jgi:hypothetical protein
LSVLIFIPQMVLGVVRLGLPRGGGCFRFDLHRSNEVGYGDQCAQFSEQYNAAESAVDGPLQSKPVRFRSQQYVKGGFGEHRLRPLMRSLSE